MRAKQDLMPALVNCWSESSKNRPLASGLSGVRFFRIPGKWLIFRSRFGTPEWIRTTDLLLRRQTLYPAELRAHNRVLQL